MASLVQLMVEKKFSRKFLKFYGKLFRVSAACALCQLQSPARINEIIFMASKLVVPIGCSDLKMVNGVCLYSKLEFQTITVKTESSSSDQHLKLANA